MVWVAQVHQTITVELAAVALQCAAAYLGLNVIVDLNHETPGLAGYCRQYRCIFCLDSAAVTSVKIMFHVHLKAGCGFSLRQDFARCVIHATAQSCRNNDGTAFSFGKNWVQAFADYYLSKAHRDDLASGCAMTTLSPEVVRSDKKVHAVYEARMVKITGLIAKGLAGGTPAQLSARAWVMLSTLIGGLTTARAVASDTLADEIAAAVKEAAIKAAGEVA